MATLRELAREHITEASDAVCWFALWKTGRTWNMEPFYVDYDERTHHFRIFDEDHEKLREILKDDYGAKFVNGWYDNLGSLEDMTVSSLTDGLRYQYEHGRQLCDCLI